MDGSNFAQTSLPGRSGPCQGLCTGSLQGGFAVWRQSGDPATAPSFSVTMTGAPVTELLDQYHVTVLSSAAQRRLVSQITSVVLSKSDMAKTITFTGAALSVSKSSAISENEELFLLLRLSRFRNRLRPMGRRVECAYFISALWKACRSGLIPVFQICGRAVGSCPGWFLRQGSML